MKSWILLILVSLPSIAAIKKENGPADPLSKVALQERLRERSRTNLGPFQTSLIFDLPVIYNRKVSNWIKYFEGRGRPWYAEWLQRSARFMPMIQKVLREQNLPQDLGYMVMIESGFEPNAISRAHAVGPWQFMKATGKHYGLEESYWLDERRDLSKSTMAAIKYLRDLYKEFGSWYLVAASYNMGESSLRNKIHRHQSRDFWELSKLGALPSETVEYVPKILAAMMIAKSPSLYGFPLPNSSSALECETASIPGGTDLTELADHLGLTPKSLKDLNAELLLGYVPKAVKWHTIHVPKGSLPLVAEFLQTKESVVRK